MQEYLVLIDQLVHNLLYDLLLFNQLVLSFNLVANLLKVPGDHLRVKGLQFFL